MRISKPAALALCALLAAGALLHSRLAAAAAPAKVRTLCQNCHGLDGAAVLPGAANLSGQQKEYLQAQLREFRSGQRQNPQMSVVAKTLSDAEIDEVAEWYSRIKVSVEPPK